MIWLYNVLLLLASPIWLAAMLWKNFRRGTRADWRERQGSYAIQPGPQRVWVHAVSVGEVAAVAPILAEVRRLDPDLEVVLTTTTPTGRQMAESRLTGLFDHLYYFPIDVPRFQLAALARVRPAAVALVETELWMNFLGIARNMGIRTLLINGRISDRSYRRLRRVRPLYRAIVRLLDRCLVQTEVDAQRLRELGAREVEVMGNAKYDEAVPPGTDARQRWREELGVDPEEFLTVIGSTRGPEDESVVANAILAVAGPGSRFVWAPRHMDRIEAIESMVSGRISTARRTEGKAAELLILDTFGELAEVYAAADAAIVGGGFGPHGGQNLVQPLAAGVPVIHGPHMQNFREAAQEASRAGASLVADNAQDVARFLRELRDDPKLRSRMGRSATQVVEAHRGAARRYAHALVEAVRRSR